MWAALTWTISDFSAYAMLSGWSTKGKFACPCCNYGTNSRYLKHSRKMCYMDHRVFLPMDHSWRFNKRSINGKTEFRPSPSSLKGTDVLNSLHDFENVFGKKRKRSNDVPWKKRSIFFELPYWQHNLLRHNLDVMHIEKNIVDSILGTLLDISGKTKDHAKARYDLKDMGIRKNLHPKNTEDSKRTKFAKAWFSMTNREKSIFCGVLKTAKLPDDNGEVLLTRTDVPKTIVDVPSEEFVTQQRKVEYEEEFEDELKMIPSSSLRERYNSLPLSNLSNEKLSSFGVEPTECFCCNSPELDTIEHIFNSGSFARKIKREQLANERNDRDKKEQAPIPHKRKNYEDFIPQQGKSKLLGHKSVIQSSSREELRTSHMIAGKGQTKPRLFQSGESIKEKGIKLPMNNSRFQTSFKEGVTASIHMTGTTLGNGEVQHDIEDLLNFKHVKRKSVRPATNIDLFLDKQQIHNERDIPDPIINDLVDQEELGGDECDVEEKIDIDCSLNLEERKEMTFDKGQAVGPTNKIVSQLSNFIGTIARNPRFISLMYTSWHAVPKDTKKRMWEYINSKFLIPVEGKKWVMTGLHDAWRRHKQKIKENFFDKNNTLEDMLAKRPDGIPDNQFRQLIEYLKHPTVQRAAKDNNEEPSRPEMFIATRTKTEKEIQADTQVAIAELQNCQNSGETTDDAFRAVKE
ncbi:hypothetical protein MTR67_018364 [Solanum verrucosum]|uniref:Uncharacterized protein n=1 Tax=Solanum verrucosum TaxID=315347 RepID=A0AAF0QS23_SOLVR|nr:hypothetical protein MTR67_018364 [Solanum verrucosum]